MNTATLPAGARLTQNLQGAWRWWTGELRAVFAPQIARWLADEETVTELTVDGDKLRAADAKEWVLVPGDSEASLRAMPSLWKGRDIRLTLDAGMVLQKRVSYPQATEENLQGMVGFDLDRQTPFAADQVYFHARVVERDAQRGTIDVELTAIPRAALRDLLQFLRAAGSRVLAIGLAGDRGNPRIDLLPVEDRTPRRLTRAQKINLGLLGAAILLLLLALWVPILQKREAVKALIPEVGKAESEAEISRRVESEYSRLIGQYKFLTEKKYANYTAMEVVEEISKLTPDTAWLRQMDIKTNAKARELQLQGEAASASKMIELLEQSPLLQNTTQRAQTTRGQLPNTESFNVATEIKARPAPALVPISAPSATPLVASPAATAAPPPPVVTATAAPPAAATAASPAAANPAPPATATSAPAPVTPSGNTPPIRPSTSAAKAANTTDALPASAGAATSGSWPTAAPGAKPNEAPVKAKR